MKTTKRQHKALASLNLDLFKPESLASPAPATLHTLIREHSQTATAAIVEMAPLEEQAGLPTVSDLYRLFDRYNWMYFQGRLPRVTIEYSGRMTSAGAYLPGQRLIRIGRRYHEIFPEDIPDTLKHEMIHIIHLNHNAAFKAEAARVGASLKARPHPALRRPPKYLYVCPNCGGEYPRQKRLILASCGHCSPGGRYDARFKLRLSRRLR
jgi:predicted SprT family Zn-dependent metalloprotease